MTPLTLVSATLRRPRVLGAVLVALISSVAVADEWTVRQEILRTQYNADGDTLYFVGTSAWGSTTCPSALYVQISNTLAGKDKLLAIGLAAHMAGKNVQFRGTCDAAGGNYFYASYVIVD